MTPTQREWGLLLALAGAGGLLRARVALRAGVIVRDGIGYLETAAHFARGDWGAGFTQHTAPGFPLAIGLAARTLGVAPSEGLACAISILAGCLSVVFGGLLAARAWGPAAGRFTALVLALLPLLVEAGGEVLSESLFVACALGSLWATARLIDAQRPPAHGPAWGALAGALGGLAYLARPEGVLLLAACALVVLALPRASGMRRRALDLLWLALPGLVVVLLFAWTIRDHAVLGGSQGGAWKLTLKRNLSHHLGRASLVTWTGNALEQLRQTAKALAWALPLAAAAALSLREAGPRRRGWRSGGGVAALLLTSAAALSLAYVIVRPDRRYAAPLAALLAPLLAAGAARWAARSGGRAPVAVALAFSLACLGGTWRPLRQAKVSYRDAGALLQGWGAQRVLAHDNRAAYYAGALPVHLLHHLPEAQQRADPQAWLRLARAQGADAIVVRVEDERGVALSASLTTALGAPERVRVEGAVPLDVFRCRD